MNNKYLILALTMMAIACQGPSKDQKTGEASHADAKETQQPSLEQLTAGGILTPELMWRMGRISEIDVSPDNQQIVYGVSRYNLSDNKGDRNLYIMGINGGEPIQVTDFEGSEFNPRWRPDGKKIGFISAKSGSPQLWEIDPDGSNPQQISNLEGGINGFHYSPDQQYILFTKDVKLDITPNEMHPDLPKANARIIDDMMYRHWDSWHDYAYSHVFYSNYGEGLIEKGTDIMEGEPYDTPMNPWGGMEQISWSPDSKKIAYTCKKLKGKEWTISTNSEIYLYDLGSGTTENLSANGFDGYDWDPVFSPDGTQLLWRSMEEPGFEADKERIIQYDLVSGEVTDLTEGFDQSCHHFCWSNDGSSIYFISGINATYQIFSLDPASRQFRQITEGVHDYQDFALAGDRIAGIKMSMSMPSEIFSIDPASGQETQLSFTNKEILDRITMGKVEERWITTTDNQQMLTWIIYPPGFDPQKKYPALLYCQGGPQSAVSQFFSYRWNFQMMAANGYIVIAPNRRGLPTFGQEWNDQISGDYGGQNMKDYLSAVDAMVQEPFVDKDHIGAVGASYGGYSVFWLAGNHNGRFKAFISHCGMYNLESQYGTTEEFFFVNKDLGGPYWQKPKPVSFGFSPHLYVDKWDTPIMIITGANDFRIPYTQSLDAFNAAQLRGIPSRLLFFPDESHFVLKPQNAVMWQREFFKWLDEWLK